jgi:hypothetical protein
MQQSYYKVKLGHTRVTLVALVDKSRTNVTKMTGNPAYATPTPPLADVATAADRLDSAIQAYDFSHSRQDKEERDTAFTELKDLRTRLGAYVQVESKGELALITSAGFETVKAREPHGRLPAPQNLTAAALPYPGQVEVRFAGVPGRDFYSVFICSSDPSVAANWSLYTSTGKNRVIVDGLESNTQYYFRVVAVGAAGHSPVSDVATAKAA